MTAPIKQTGATYRSSRFAKTLAVGPSKLGKTTALVANLLGVFPWQKYGGVITRPENLHIITCDASALSGVATFLTKYCNAPVEALNYNVYNFQDVIRETFELEADNPKNKGYDSALFASLLACRDDIEQQCKKSGEVSAVLVSSLTGLAGGIERAMMGRPDDRGYGDQNKWQIFKARMFEIQNVFHRDLWHCIWEGHITKVPKGGKNNDGEEKDSLSVSGKAGKDWAFNVEQVFRLRRELQLYEKTGINQVKFDTKPTLDFVANSRGSMELADQEIDLTVVYKKLGLEVGQWGFKRA